MNIYLKFHEKYEYSKYFPFLLEEIKKYQDKRIIIEKIMWNRDVKLFLMRYFRTLDMPKLFYILQLSKDWLSPIETVQFFLLKIVNKFKKLLT